MKSLDFAILFTHMKLKDYESWFVLKPKLHSADPSRHVNARDIWWCSIGINIGHEMDGKSGKASRPVLVLRKLSAYTFVGLPLTSKEKMGSWYVPITIHRKVSRVILSQVRVFDVRRLTTKIAQLDTKDFKEVRKRFIEFYSS